MPISPETAAIDKAKNLKAKLDALEFEIDAYLLKHWTGGGRVDWDLPPGGVELSILDQILTNYRAVGWCVVLANGYAPDKHYAYWKTLRFTQSIK